MTSLFQKHGDHTSFFKDCYFKNLKQKTPVVFGSRSYWLQYPRKNLILFQVSFCLSVGLPTKEFPLESFLALSGFWHKCRREMKAAWFFLRRQVDVCLRCRNLLGLRVRHLRSSAGLPLPGLPASGDPGFLLHKVSVSVFIEQRGRWAAEGSSTSWPCFCPVQLSLSLAIFRGFLAFILPMDYRTVTPGFPYAFVSLEFVLLVW